MASMCSAVGTGILDIGVRKAAVTGPATEGLAGQHVPGMFGLPNVSNVSSLGNGRAAVSQFLFILGLCCLLSLLNIADALYLCRYDCL